MFSHAVYPLGARTRLLACPPVEGEAPALPVRVLLLLLLAPPRSISPALNLFLITMLSSASGDGSSTTESLSPARDGCQHCFPFLGPSKGADAGPAPVGHVTVGLSILASISSSITKVQGPPGPVLSSPAPATRAEQTLSRSWQAATACRSGEARALSQQLCPEVCWSPHARPVTPSPGLQVAELQVEFSNQQRPGAG